MRKRKNNLQNFSYTLQFSKQYKKIITKAINVVFRVVFWIKKDENEKASLLF